MGGSNTTMKEWHDTQKAAESIVKKLNTYYLDILKQKIADYSHFTIEEFHELASELLTIQCAEEEKQVEKERGEEQKTQKYNDEVRIEIEDDNTISFTNRRTGKHFRLYDTPYSRVTNTTIKSIVDGLTETEGEG